MTEKNVTSGRAIASRSLPRSWRALTLRFARRGRSRLHCVSIRTIYGPFVHSRLNVAWATRRSRELSWRDGSARENEPGRASAGRRARSPSGTARRADSCVPHTGDAGGRWYHRADAGQGAVAAVARARGCQARALPAMPAARRDPVDAPSRRPDEGRDADVGVHGVPAPRGAPRAGVTWPARPRSRARP